MGNLKLMRTFISNSGQATEESFIPIVVFMILQIWSESGTLQETVGL